MSTTYAQTIDGNKIYAERSVQDKDGNQIDTTYAKVASLATVATTGDYGDLLNKPSIPAAQVQSDWNESDTNDPSYIQNKPTIPSGSELVPSYSLPTDEGKVLTVGSSTTVWATPSAPNTKPVVAGSNIVITENTNNVTISTTGLQPSLPTISGHSGDVLTVNSQGNAIEWAPSQGGTQVQADWAETSTSDPSYIQNKPTMNSLAAGSNISLTPSGSTVTVAVTGLATVATSGDYGDLSNTPTIPSGTQLVPTATIADADKVLTVDAQGTPGWASAQAPITAGNGIDITNNVVSVDTSVVATQTDLAGKEDVFDVGTGLEMDTSGATPTLQVEAPVDIVAGPGIVIDNPDGNTLRVSVDQAIETVLYENTSGAAPSAFPVTLSEATTNFETIRFYFRPWSSNSCVVEKMGDQTIFMLESNWVGSTASSVPYSFLDILTVSGTQLSFTRGTFNMWSQNTLTEDTTQFRLFKVVGVHRIANN